MKIVKEKIEMRISEDFKIRWCKFSFEEQMANIGADIGRAMIWAKKDERLSKVYLATGLELLTLTMGDLRNKSKAHELDRLRRELIDSFSGNEVKKNWDEYFYPYNVVATAKYFK